MIFSALSYIDISNLGDRIWPSSKTGYTIAFWFHILETEDNKSGSEAYLFSFDCSKNKLEISFTASGVLKLHFLNETFEFSNFLFQPGKWYHALLIHGSTSSKNKKGSVKLFVNGICRQVGTFSPPKSNTGKVLGRIGASAFTNSKSDLCWQLGNVFFFEETLS